MINAQEFTTTETLKNGLSVTIRAIRPSDKAGIVEAFGKLDRDTIYTRFFGAKDSLSDNELKAATEVDFEDAVALVVTIESGGSLTITVTTGPLTGRPREPRLRLRDCPGDNHVGLHDSTSAGDWPALRMGH